MDVPKYNLWRSFACQFYDRPVSESESETLEGTEKKMSSVVCRIQVGKRSQKKMSCHFCGKLNSKMSRHLQTYHSDELEVSRVLCFPKGSKMKKNAWALLSAKGNYLHNIKVEERGTGEIIPKYRPKDYADKMRYAPCEFCKAYCVVSDLWKHHRSCPGR